MPDVPEGPDRSPHNGNSSAGRRRYAVLTRTPTLDERLSPPKRQALCRQLRVDAIRGIQRPSATTRREVRAWFNELAGTTILLFAAVLVTRWLFGPGSVVADAVSGLPARLTIVGATTGSLLALLIISPIGRSSGGHFNPAVSVTFWLLRRMAPRDVAAYVVAQLAGSVIGVLLGRMALGSVVADPAVNYAALRPASGWSNIGTFSGEAALFALLMVAVVAFLSQPVLALWTPAVVGTLVGLLCAIGAVTSGGSCNPARQFGPLLFAHQWSHLFPYLLGPVVGGIVLAVLIQLFGLPRPIVCGLCGEPPRDLPAPGS